MSYRVSSFCTSGGCVQVARLGDGVVLRDAASDTVRYSRAEWDAFVAGVNNGEFDWDTLRDSA